MKKRSQLAAGNDGQEIAELAVVLPILFSLIFGVFSFARAYNIYSTITRAAQDGARFAAAPKPALGTGYTCGSNGSQFPGPSDIAAVVNAAILASHLDPSQVTSLSPASTNNCPAPAPVAACSTPNLGSTTGQISICQNVVVNSNTTNTALQMCGTIVSFQYSYRFLPVPFIRMTAIQIPASAQVRVEF